MGCSASCVTIHSVKGELPSYITRSDISIVQESWKMISPDIENVGLAIFQRFFVQSREVKKMFVAHLRVDDDIFDEFGMILFDKRKVRDHARIVMEALGSAVECLNDSKQLTSILIGIGERHVMYGIDPDMVPLLWQPIIITFEEHLGARFTPQIGQAWENVFNYIANTVIGGMRRWQAQPENKCSEPQQD